jgi:hypothetical protein
VVVHVTLEIFGPVETFATQLAIVRPYGMHHFLMKVEINARLALVRTIRNIAVVRLVFLHVRPQVRRDQESLPATNVKTLENTIFIVSLHVSRVANLAFEPFVAMATSVAEASV